MNLDEACRREFSTRKKRQRDGCRQKETKH